MKELTWSWLAGFFQAEGTVGEPPVHKTLSISQAEREPLDLIVEFISTYYPQARAKVRGSFGRGRGIYTLYIHFLALRSFCAWLRVEKLYRAAKWLKVTCDNVPTCLPIDDDWIAGFWEGDGSVYLAGALDIQVVFTQRPEDVVVLEEVKKYLLQYDFGNGTVYDYRYPILAMKKYPSHSAARLTYHCGVHNQNLLKWLYGNVRCSFRKQRLGTFLDALRKFREESELEEYENYPKRGYHMPPSIKALYQPRK